MCCGETNQDAVSSANQSNCFRLRSIRCLFEFQIGNDHAVIGMGRIVSPDSYRTEMRGVPDLVDAMNGEVAHDRISPATASRSEGIGQPIGKRFQTGVSRHEIKIAAEDDRIQTIRAAWSVVGNDLTELLSMPVTNGSITFPAGGSPKIQTNERWLKP